MTDASSWRDESIRGRWDWPNIKDGEVAPPDDYEQPDPNVLMGEMVEAANKVEVLTVGYHSNEPLMGDFLDSLIEAREITFRTEGLYDLLIDQQLIAKTLTEEISLLSDTYLRRFLPSVLERIILKTHLFTFEGVVASEVELIARSMESAKGEFELRFRALMPLSSTDLKAIYKVVQEQEDKDFAKWLWSEHRSLPGQEGQEIRDSGLREQFVEDGWRAQDQPPGMETIWQQVWNIWHPDRQHPKAETPWRKKAIEFTEDLAVYIQALLNNYGLEEAKVDISRTGMARDDLVEFKGGFVYHFGFPRSRWFSHTVEPGKPRENQWYSFAGKNVSIAPRTWPVVITKVWKDLGKLSDYKGGDPDENFIFVEFSSSLRGWL